MTYATGSASSLVDLLSKLDTFAQTTHGGWTSIYSPNPDTTNRWFELKKGSLSFSMRYPASIAAGNAVSVHQATGSSSAATAPGLHTADSNNGYNTAPGGTSANFLAERCVSEIGNGPFPSYHFFADDTAPADYIHVVVEITTGMFRHFGFGKLDKFGNNWTGGEYVYGHFVNQATNATPVDAVHSFLLNALGTTTTRLRDATVRIASGLANQGAAVWGVCNTASSANLLLDTAGNARQQIIAGGRGGVIASAYGNPMGNNAAGFVTGYPIDCFYKDPSNLRVYLLGKLSDTRIVNIRNFAAGETIVIGSETWHIFPMSQKTSAAIAGRSGFLGVMYREVP